MGEREQYSGSVFESPGAQTSWGPFYLETNSSPKTQIWGIDRAMSWRGTFVSEDYLIAVLSPPSI